MLSFLLLAVTAGAGAQVDSLPLDRDFRFADGIYFSHAALQQNRPDLAWEAVDGRLIQLPDDYRLQIEHFRQEDEPLHERVYAVSLQGFPYLTVRYEAGRDFTELAGLRVRGRLCYLEYDTIRQRPVVIRAYNPVTGRPFRQSTVTRSERERVRRILDFATGRIYPYNRNSLEQLLAGDAILLRAVQTVDEAEEEEKLYRSLLIYDDRHPLYLPVDSTQSN